jgi:hypothetical protein
LQWKKYDAKKSKNLDRMTEWGMNEDFPFHLVSRGQFLLDWLLNSVNLGIGG